MDYSEILCQAVDTIVKQRLSSISYDQTTICTVVDDSKREQGIYVVSNGSVKFEAFSEVTTYRNNMNVYVTVPEGDWNQAKFIVGRKTANTDEAYNYRKPFDSLVDVTENVISYPPMSTNTGLVANAVDENKIVLWSYNVDDSGALRQEKGDAFRGYTRLGLQAAFQSWLDLFYTTEMDEDNNKVSVLHHVVEGDYGLRLILTTENGKTTEEETAKTGTYQIELGAHDMNGNPYDFKSFFQQEKTFDISEIGDITQIVLEFYEKPGSFIDDSGNQYPYTDFLGNPIAPNLFVKDVYLCFGYDTSAFGDNQVVLYASVGGMTFSAAQSDTKTVNLRWIHNFGSNDFKVVKPTDGLEYEIRWYRYKLGAQSADEYSGVYWQEVVENRNEFSYEFIPDITVRDERIKAIIFYNNQVLRSNVLIYNNENDVVSQATVDAMSAVGIHCVDNTYGNYRIYALGNSLIDSSDSARVRDFQIYFNGAVLTEAEQVEWVIPTVNTMIEIDPEFYAGAQHEVIDGDLHIIRYGDAEGTISEANTKQKYRIRSYYSQNYSNNTIECIVTKDRVEYFGSKELTFGPAGTSGTDCTFVLDFDKGVTALTANSSEAVTVTARLYDYENNEVDLTKETATITWGWKTGTSNSNIELRAPDENSKISRELVYNGRTVPQTNYAVLQATLNGWGDYALIAYLPIPIRSSMTYRFIEGPTSVIYDALGYTSSFYQNPLKLWQASGDSLIEATDVTWKIQCSDSASNNFYPKVTQDSNGNYRLQPPCIYIDNLTGNVCLYCQISGSTVWAQPLLIMQNRYPSKMLNDWDGQLNLGGSDGNTLLSARVAAGVKESDNTFSGVILGSWNGQDNETSISQNTGIYGFYHGAASYGFRDDGTAFIGKAGAGRIEFDGSKSIIQSATYTDGAGMQLNLQTGAVNAHQFTLSANGTRGNFTFSTEAATYPLQIGTNFKVKWDGSIEATGVNISGEINATSGTLGDLTVTGTLDGGTISGSTITGGSITIGENFTVNSLGELTATNASFSGAITGGTIEIGDNFNVTKDGTLTASGATFSGKITGGTIDIGSNFSVSSDGNIIAKNADISGKINATSGKIGGWTINTDSITGGNTTLNSNGQITTEYFKLYGGIGQFGSFNGLTGQYYSTDVIGIHSPEKSIVIESYGNDTNDTSGNIRLKSQYNSVYVETGSHGNFVVSMPETQQGNAGAIEFRNLYKLRFVFDSSTSCDFYKTDIEKLKNADFFAKFR